MLSELPAAIVTVTAGVNEIYSIGVGGGVAAATVRLSDDAVARAMARAGVPDGGDVSTDSVTKVETVPTPREPFTVIPLFVKLGSVAAVVVDEVTVPAIAGAADEVGALIDPPPQPATMAATAAMATSRNCGEPACGRNGPPLLSKTQNTALSETRAACLSLVF